MEVVVEKVFWGLVLTELSLPGQSGDMALETVVFDTFKIWTLQSTYLNLVDGGVLCSKIHKSRKICLTVNWFWSSTVVSLEECIVQCDKINCSIKDLCSSHQILLMCVIDLPNQLRELKPIKTFLEAITRAARLLRGAPASHIKGLCCFNPWWLLCWGSWWEAVSLLLTKAGYSDSSLSFPMCLHGQDPL